VAARLWLARSFAAGFGVDFGAGASGFGTSAAAFFATGFSARFGGVGGFATRSIAAIVPLTVAVLISTGLINFAVIVAPSGDCVTLAT
jgi:hypothetical protein